MAHPREAPPTKSNGRNPPIRGVCATPKRTLGHYPAQYPAQAPRADRSAGVATEGLPVRARSRAAWGPPLAALSRPLASLRARHRRRRPRATSWKAAAQ